MDTRGPVVNTNMTVVADSEGVQAPGYQYAPPGEKPSPWQAKWIAPAGGQGETILLRQTVTLEEAPAHIRAWVTAGAAFQLYVNGRLADRGPADSGRDYDGGTTGRWFYDCRDLTPLFHRGKNVIAAVVLSGEAPFLFEAQAQMPGAHTLTLATNASWRGMRTDYLTGGGSHFDGNKEPVGWLNAGFDDAAWPACIQAPGVRETLTASDLPPCMEADYPMLGIDRVTGGVQVPAKPFNNGHSIVVSSDGSFAVRFRRILSARCGMEVKGGAGAQIELQPHEINARGGSNPSSFLTLRDGVQYFESPGFASVGTINVIVSHVTTPVEIIDVSADFTSQPVAYGGDFACSDENLTHIWQSCRWATQICLQTWHLDSPQHQEPISDYGDYLIADRVSFDAFGNDPWLARQDLRKWAWVMKNRDYHTFHTSYTLLWLQSLMQYYDHTGDLGTVKELSPYVYGLLERFDGYRGKNGLISEAPNYMFMDWVTIAGFNAHHPPAVIGQGYLTAFYCRALSDAARVAELTGEPARAKAYRQTREETVAAYNRELWDPAKDLYRDGKPFQTTVKPNGWLPADTDIQTWSAQNNVLAVLYDLAPKERQRAIIDNTMAQTPWNVRPYYMHFVLDAISHAGLFDKYGTVWMRKWHIVPQTQTFYEMGDQGDLSHGWIATPLCQMSENILGVRAEAPAYRTLSIRPTLCDLAWAKGSVPTPHGPVNVNWRRAGDGLTLTVKVPPGTVADVAIPALSTQAVLTAGSKKLWAGGHATRNIAGLSLVHKEGGAIVVRAAPGMYTFVGHRLGLPALKTDTVGTVVPLPISAKTIAGSQAAFEADIVKDSLIGLGRNTCTVAAEVGVAHLGGGTNADAVHNGTTRNGVGGEDTQDDGKTFRGYGTGSSITFALNMVKNPAGYDLTKIVTFAGHGDSRASQSYSVSVAFASHPSKFVVLVPAASAASDGGSSEIIIHNPQGGVIVGAGAVRAAHVVGVRFDFSDGSVEKGSGMGFNVYREIQIFGQPTTK